MQPKTLEKRVEALEVLPARVDALEVQISEFRAEVRAEFSATRTELRQEMRELNAATMTQVRVLHEDVIKRFELLDEHAGRKRTSAPRRRKR